MANEKPVARSIRAPRAWTSVFLLLALVASACSSGDGDPESQTTPVLQQSEQSTSGDLVESLSFDEALSSSTSLQVRLSNGDPGAPVVEEARTELVEGQPLTNDEIDEVLRRVGLASETSTEAPAEVADVNRPAETLLPPTVDSRIDLPFPIDTNSPAVPAAPADGPLEVLRVQPEGDVNLAPFISVTFNEPMIPLSTLDQLDQLEVPVEITPSRETLAERGFVTRWRWLGTRTARLEVVPNGGIDGVGLGENATLDRLPGATEFTITVPAGTESVNGATLDGTQEFTFTTRTPEPLWVFGVDERMSLNPVMGVVFDQRVQPTAAIEAIEFESGDVTLVRLATADEVAAEMADPTSEFRWLDQPADHIVFVTPTEALVADTAVRLRVGPGVPSREGPLVGTGTVTENGRTFPPLELEDDGCANGCQPLQTLFARFSNEIDTDAFDPAWVTIRPELPGARVEVFSNVIAIGGATQSNTEYDVFFAAELTDIFGQTLGREARADFDIGDTRRAFAGPNNEFVITDPFADSPGLRYQTIDHDALRVRAWSVQPEQYEEFQRFSNGLFEGGWQQPGTWPELASFEVPVDRVDGTVVETTVDLSEVFAQTSGSIAVLVEPADDIDRNSRDYWNNRPVFTWVQSTNLAVDAFSDGSELLVWVTDLSTGEPIPDADVRLLGERNETLATNSNGLLSIDLDEARINGLDVSANGQRVVSPRSTWTMRANNRDGLWFVTDDRGVYRPGETVRLVGLYRWPSPNRQPTLTPNTSITYRVRGPRNNDLGSGEIEMNAFGGFNLAVDLPEGIDAGTARIVFNRGSNRWVHNVAVQDFRTPDFDASVDAVDAGPYVLGEPATFAASASYFAGGPLADSPVLWTVSTQGATFSPPNWGDFSFGEWSPPWFYGYDDVGFFGSGEMGPADIATFAATTDSSGRHLLQADFASRETPNRGDDGDDNGAVVIDQPSNVRFEATITDVNRQTISANTSVLVHPAEYYVGLRSDVSFVEPGEPLVVDAVVVDLEGAPVAGRSVEVTAGRIRESFVDGRFVSEVIDAQTCTVTSTTSQVNSVNSVDRDESMRCAFTPEAPGRWEISAVVSDEEGRQSRATLTQWVSGGTASSVNGLDGDVVTVIPNAESYAPEESAEILVQAPFANASGLLIVDRAGIQSVVSFSAPDGSAVLTVPIDSADVPNINIRVEMVGATDRRDSNGAILDNAPQQPAFATGHVRLDVATTERTLDVVAVPAATELAPGETTSVEVRVTNADGEPVDGAGVSVIVVDEAVLSLTGFELGDPIDSFYPEIGQTVTADLLRNSVLLSSPEIRVVGEATLDSGDDELVADEEAMEDEDATADFVSGADQTPAETASEVSAPASSPRANNDETNEATIDLRDNFGPLAVFVPEEVTNADGSATITFDLPDSLTRYRVMAIANAGADTFGTGEAQITARLPLSVRPTAPAFLNFGDEFELPVIVQNLGDDPAEVDLAVSGENIQLTGATGMRVTIPANSRVEVRFPAQTEAVGTATMQIAATSTGFGDAAIVSIAVFTPATAEAFATYGALDDGTAVLHNLRTPDGVLAEIGGLDITTSSTAVSALTDAVLYLSDYQFESADGLASRIMAIAALRDVLEAFDAEGLPSANELDAQVQRDIDSLIALQNSQGTWSWWQGGEIAPWVTVQATHAMVLAEQNGFSVRAQALENGLNASRDIQNFFADENERTRQTRWATRAYGLYVVNVSGRDVSDEGMNLYREAGEDLDLGSAAQLLTVIDDEIVRAEILRRISNGAVETASAATFATDFGQNGYLIAHSNRRTDGIILDALVREDPENDLIVKAVNALLANQTRGRWNNAQENAFILLAMNEYFSTFEEVTPEFVAQAWLGQTYVHESAFEGRSTNTVTTRVPMSEVLAIGETGAGDSELIVRANGEGRLYYRLGLDYAPSDFDLDARDEGFVVVRTYEAIDDPSDVRLLDDGTWEIRAGANVRVTITMVADARRNHVALVDPLAAGLEAVNPALATSPTIVNPGQSGDGYYRQWFNHQNLRSDRVEAFAIRLWGGTFEYSYVAQATIPGSFVVPPATAEEIFTPEVFGRSGSDRVVIVDRSS